MFVFVFEGIVPKNSLAFLRQRIRVHRKGACFLVFEGIVSKSCFKQLTSSEVLLISVL